MRQRERGREREYEHISRGSGRQREREKQTTGRPGNKIKSLIPGPWDHDLSRKQMLKLTELPRPPQSLYFEYRKDNKKLGVPSCPDQIFHSKATFVASSPLC